MDPQTRKLVVNEKEAGAVRLIFDLYNKDRGYGEIIDELNSRGYKTKKGASFGKGSLYEILRNEKYKGVYIYNKSVGKDVDGKYNRHSYKDDASIIRIEGGVPEIINPSVFDRTQEKMEERRKCSAKFKAKQEYLLTGKIRCGVCGSSYVGNMRHATGSHPLYVSYRCTRKNGAVKCNNTEVKKENIERDVVSILSERIFDPSMLPTIFDTYKTYVQSISGTTQTERTQLLEQSKEIERKVNNIINVISNTGSDALVEKLNELDREKQSIQKRIRDLDNAIDQSIPNIERMQAIFENAKEKLLTGTLKNQREIINIYVESIVLYREKIEMHLRPFLTYEMIASKSRETRSKKSTLKII